MTIWGYGDFGREPGIMATWGYAGGQPDIAHALAFTEVFDILDTIELVIPSWLRKVYVGDNVYYIKITRIR